MHWWNVLPRSHGMLTTLPHFQHGKAGQLLAIRFLRAREFQFPDPDGRVTQEQALLVDATRYYLQSVNAPLKLFEGLPPVPEPLRFPKQTTSLDVESWRWRAAPRNEETAYIVPINNIGEPPRSKLYWPWGTPVRRNEIFKIKEQWFLTPELGYESWSTENSRRSELVQDERGDFVWKVPEDGEWEQDAHGHFVRKGGPEPMQVIQLNLTPGDRQPPAEDPRQCFRYGHWYTQAEVNEVEENAPPPVLPVPEEAIPTPLYPPDRYGPPAKSCWDGRPRFSKEL